MKKNLPKLKFNPVQGFFPFLKAGLVLIVLVFLWGFALKRQQMRVVNSIKIEIENEAENHFVDEETIENAISVGQNNLVFMRWLDSVSLGKLEKRIENIEFVKNAEVSMDLNSNIHVHVRLVKPVARIVAGGSEFDRYIGADGEVLPTSEKYASKVITVDGPGSRRLSYPGFASDSSARALLELFRIIEEDQFWHAQITHMFIDQNFQISLSTQVGGQEIEFGSPFYAKEKLEKLMAFYEKIVPVQGWNAYKRVSVKYRNQIVCQKTS